MSHLGTTVVVWYELRFLICKIWTLYNICFSKSKFPNTLSLDFPKLLPSKEGKNYCPILQLRKLGLRTSDYLI